MRGALSPKVRCLHRAYTLPSMTGIATAIYEDLAGEPSASERAPAARARRRAAEGRRAIGRQLSVHDRAQREGVPAEPLPARARRARLPCRFLADPEAAFERAGLTDDERDLVRRRDWIGLIRYGVIFFMLEKLGAVIGVSNLHIYAAMRGESLEEFQKTRNAPVAVFGRRQGRRRACLGYQGEFARQLKQHREAVRRKPFSALR